MPAKDHDKAAEPTVTDNGDGTTLLSIKLSEMNLEQLERVAAGLLNQADKIRAQRLHIRQLIDLKLASKNRDDINAQIARLEAIRDGKALPDEGAVDGNAPGAVIEVKASSAPKTDV